MTELVISALDRLQYDQTGSIAQIDSETVGVAELISETFWGQLPLDTADSTVLLELTSENIEQLCNANAKKISGLLAAGPWGQLPAASIVFLQDCSFSDVVKVAQIGFDGIVVYPFTDRQLAESLENAAARAADRYKLFGRNQKLRNLCRGINRNRRKLRDKVDLICHDLVDSNLELANKLHRLQRVYNFQSEIAGEFDLKYMLHKALRRFRSELPDSSGAIYLCRDGEFSAHLAGAWYDQPRDICQIEDTLEKTLIREVLSDFSAVLVPDAAMWSVPEAKESELLAGLSILAAPAAGDDELLAVVAMYRNVDKPFTEDDMDTLQSLIGPLAKAIANLQRLKPHLLVAKRN